MTLTLIDLSPELMLRIADLLLADDPVNEESSVQDVGGYHPLKRWYEKTQTDEPSGKEDGKSDDDANVETTQEASETKQEPQYDQQEKESKAQQVSGQEVLISLSRTCSLLYKTLSPYLVSDVILRNTVKSGKAVQYLRSTEQAKHVRTLLFKGDAPGDEEEGFHDVEAVFPPEVEDVLRNLSQFQNLITVKIDFDFLLDETGYHKWSLDSGTKFYMDDETRAEMEEAETKEAWRALVRKTFDAISCPTSDQFSELVFCYWPLCGSSAFGRYEDDDELSTSVPPLNGVVSPFYLLSSVYLG